VAKIDGKKITLSEFNDLYYSQHRMVYSNKTNTDIDKLASDPVEQMRNPLLNKGEFLNQLISSRLLYNKAVSDGFTKRDDVEALCQVQYENFLSEYYFAKTAKDSVKVTDEEVAQAYQMYQAQLKAMPVDEAENRIRQQLMQQKAMMEKNRIMQEIRSEAQIDRNDEVISGLSNSDASKRPTRGNVVKISGKSVSSRSIDVKEFNTLYYSQLKLVLGISEEAIDKMAADPVATQQNPMLNKKEFLDQVISQYLIYQHAKKSSAGKDTDAKALSGIMTEQFVGMFYIKEKYAKDLAVTEQELSDAYSKVKAKLPPNVTPDMAESYLRQQIEQQKLSAKLPEIRQSLRERAKVEKNKDLKEFQETPKPQFNFQAPAGQK
ncbi:MAG: hypothetical protein ACRCUT_13430, partial [Spirochaetota bacterium]